MPDQFDGASSSLSERISIAALLLVVYFAAGNLGLRLAYINASVSPVWPATGIAIAALLLLGTRYWPVIWIGAFFVNYTIAGSIATSAFIASGNTVEALLGAYLVNRFAGGRQAMANVSNALRFASLAVIPSTASSATIGALTLCVGHLARWREFRVIWLTWWAGDAIGALILVPPLLYFLRPPVLAKASLERKVMIALCIALASILVMGALQYHVARRLETESQWVIHTQDVIRELDAIQKRLSDADASVQKFVLTSDTGQLSAYEDAAQSVRNHLRTLQALTADNPQQQQRLASLEALISAAIAGFEKEIASRRAGDTSPEQMAALIASIESSSGDARQSISTLQAVELDLLAQRKQLARRSDYQSTALIFAGNVVAIILVGVSGLALHIDIAERRRGEQTLQATEERFRMMVEGVEDYAIYMLDPYGRVTTWNAGAERIKGYKSDEIIGRHFSTFFTGEDQQSGLPQRALQTAAKDNRWESEGWQVRKDGSKFWANALVTPIRNNAGELIGFTKVIRDFTERNRAREALDQEMAHRAIAQQRLQESESSLRRLSFHLLRAQDEERRRIGRELHDSVGQYLSVLKMKIETLMSSLQTASPSESQDELRQCADLTEESMEEVRTISYLLYPPMLEEIGLQAAMPWYLEGFSERSKIKTTFSISEDFGRMSGDLEMALFRVLQESLTNIHKHSGSPTADVRLFRHNNQAILEIVDKGKGVPKEMLAEFGQVSTGGFGVGLRGMNERMEQLGGKLEIISNGAGTVVRAVVSAVQSDVATPTAS
jgi:PAS domain S-box-containing protein